MINDRPNRRGIALILVMMVIAVAAVLGLAMLSGTMLQQRVSNNAARAARADGMAESGMNLAMYYLVNPIDIPGGGSYWAGTGSSYISFGSAPGSVNVTVTPAGTDGRTYEIVSIGKSSNDSDAISRTLKARVQSNKYTVRHAAITTQAMIVPTNTTVDGDIVANGKITLSLLSGLQLAAVVNGAGYCTSYQPLPYPKPRDGFKAIVSSALAPAAADVNKYTTYTYNDATYSAESLGGSTLSSTNLGASGSNPLGVYYRNSGTTYVIGNNVTWNGTLVVEGNLSIQGTNITFNPKDNMPALVVTGWLEIQQGLLPRIITCNGVCYVGNQLRGTGLFLSPINTTFNINGALIIASPTGTVPFNTSYKATTKLKFDPTKIRVNDLNTKITSPTSVSVVRWGPDKS